MPKIPPMNLAPEATPWGREIQARVESQEATISGLQNELTNLRLSLNSVVQSLQFFQRIP